MTTSSLARVATVFVLFHYRFASIDQKSSISGEIVGVTVKMEKEDGDFLCLEE